MLFSVEIEAREDLLDLELFHFNCQGKVYTVLKNQNIIREDRHVGGKKNTQKIEILFKRKTVKHT